VATLALNAEYIKSHAVLMSPEELMEFISYHYEEKGEENEYE
jgi:hypothetical protein